MDRRVGVYVGDAMAAYGFRPPHPVGVARFAAFLEELRLSPHWDRVRLLDAPAATDEQLRSFHTAEYVEHVRRACADGAGLLAPATPAERGLERAAAAVVGAVLDGAERLLDGRLDRAFVPIAGFHHARPTAAANSCLYNDAAIALQWLLDCGLERVAYVDIDVHHGEGVWAGFADESRVALADLHQEPESFWYGAETPVSPLGDNLAVALPPGADDEAFLARWGGVEDYLDSFRPEFVILQAGADAMEGDGVGSLRLTSRTHDRVCRSLAALADRWADGRLLVLGGGGHQLHNVAGAWTTAIGALLGG